MLTQPTLNTAYDLRGFREADRNFILATWLRGLREADHYRWMPGQYVYQRMEPIIWRLMDEHDLAILVMADDDTHIIGYACASPRALDYCYIKTHSRGIGLLPMLLDDLNLSAEHTRCTFWTRHAERFHPRWHYKPSLIEWRR